MAKIISKDSIVLDFPADYVYRTLTDFVSYSKWWPHAIKFQLEHLNPGITGTTLRVQNGPFVKWKSEIKEFRTNRLLGIDYTEGAWTGKTYWRFDSRDGRTELTLEINLDINRAWLKFLAIFLNFSGIHSKQIRKVFGNLEKYLKENEVQYLNKIRLSHLDHVVLTVTDVENTCAFYRDNFAMEIILFGNGRRALKFGDQKINLHKLTGEEANPKAKSPTPGSADLCLIALTDINVVVSELKSRGVEIVEGPVEKTGAHGQIRSVYVNDPDGNLIEISNYMK
jgi:catechol 2,3-dioxygenase-like lactoylglutathione lyase family enzyme/uncharacterized membrane protein